MVGELDPEAERLGVHPVGPARHQGEPVADRLGGQRRLQGRGVLVDLAGGVTELGGQGGVDDVGGGEPEVEVAPLVADGLLDRLDEGGDVVALLGLQLGDRGLGRPGRPPSASRAASAGIRPTAAQPSAASSSTSSHRPSRDSSLKTAAIAAGV